jgi:hypothetical protein
MRRPTAGRPHERSDMRGDQPRISLRSSGLRLLNRRLTAFRREFGKGRTASSTSSGNSKVRGMEGRVPNPLRWQRVGRNRAVRRKRSDSIFKQQKPFPPSLRAKRSNPSYDVRKMDCFVASLLAMTSADVRVAAKFICHAAEMDKVR